MLTVGIPVKEVVQSRFGKSIYLNGREISRECKACHEILDIEEFYPKSSKEAHIRRRECKSCWTKNKTYKWRSENFEQFKNLQKIYKVSDRGKETQKRAYNKKRSSPSGKISMTLRCRVGDAFRAAKKHGFNAIKKTKTLNLLGAESWEQVQYHIESYFSEGMSWDNHGEWHIDHHKPIDWFIKNKDFTKEEVQKECFNYLNLRPLWAADNQSKSNKWEEPRNIESI
tara:strand:+ start:307 stop:987 length:681 start_codon:yes stop_codon:yes gene_type:complete